MRHKYEKKAIWQKITFQSQIWVPEVSPLGFWGLVCIEKWPYNFDSGIQSAISGTSKMAEMGWF